MSVLFALARRCRCALREVRTAAHDPGVHEHVTRYRRLWCPLGDIGTSLCHAIQDIGTADHAAEGCHVPIEFETGYEANNELTPGRPRARLHHAERAREMSARRRHIGF